MSSRSSSQKSILLLKLVIRTIIIDYTLNTPIYNINSLISYLENILLKISQENREFYNESTSSFLNFLENSLVRGALFPDSFGNLILELIEILELISKARNNTITNSLF